MIFLPGPVRNSPRRSWRNRKKESMLYCPKCQQLEATTPQKHDDGTVTYLCRKCGGAIPLRRDLRPGEVVAGFFFLLRHDRRARQKRTRPGRRESLAEYYSNIDRAC